MKKFLLALLVASLVLPASAMAGSTLYGQFAYSIADVEDNVTDGKRTDDNTSLFGVKGSYGDDIKAFFHLQTQANADAQTGTKDGNAFQQRFFFGGLKGKFGKIKVGKMSNAYKMVGFKMDPFYNTAHVMANGVYGAKLATYGLSGHNNGFTDDAIEYTSPKIADAITINLGYYVDDSDDDDHGTGYGITYSKNGFTAGVQVLNHGDTTDQFAPAAPGSNANPLLNATIEPDESATRFHLGYKGEGYSIAASYEKIDEASTGDPVYIFVAGTYDVNDKTQLRLAYGTVDDESAYEGDGFAVGVYHDITTNAKIFLQYSSADLDDPAEGLGFPQFSNEDSPSVLALGTQIKFSISGE